MTTAELNAFFAEFIKEELLNAFLLVEWSFMLTGFYLLTFKGLLMLRRVRGLLPAMQTNQMLEVGLHEIIARLFTATMLMSIGVSSSFIANSLFTGDIQPVNVNTVADLTCVNGLIDGCFSKDIGKFDSSNVGGLLAMQYFNVLMAALSLLGLVTYGRGWLAFANSFSPQQQQAMPMRTVITKIFVGAAFMHPQYIYHTFL
ncbi:hypothetical protein [Photobacterium leiognathi]|uniref:hypothetical protein n=1 Tax=Photobacterium leiognathi TaxID=553611 RepID=UPI0029811CDC|nr:hypothetical protein [Photobacterium leiognathi]